jgi:dTDP-glucose 4,6-dehydratase
MRILVTGGAAFNGSVVIRHIICNARDSVVNLDKLTNTCNLEALAVVNDSECYTFEHLKTCDRTEVERIFREPQPDAVRYLATESYVDRSVDGPAGFINNNIIVHL